MDVDGFSAETAHVARPVLTDAALCDRWRDRHDISAACALAERHRPLVVELAARYRAWGLPWDDLVGEGHVGLMRAICRFDPDGGVALATFAAWWIGACLHEYVLTNWSRVGMSATARRRLVARLREVRGRLNDAEPPPRTAGAPMAATRLRQGSVGARHAARVRSTRNEALQGTAA